MESKLDFITKDLIDKAALEIDKNGVPSKRKGTGYAISIKGTNYPFKLLVTEAAKLADINLTLKDFNSKTNYRTHLEKVTGYSVVAFKDNYLKDLINKYKKHLVKVGLEEEVYKWHLLNQYKGRPNTRAVNFTEEIKEINFANLIYPVGVGVINHLAKDAAEAYRECFNVLFDESRSLEERVQYFDAETLRIYRTFVPEKRFSHHHDERTMATFLTYYNPEKYTFYKNSFYKKYCDLVGVKSKKKGEKYVHYLHLIEDLIDNYIKKDKELIYLFQKNLPNEAFNDVHFKILAQDILYQGLDKEFGNKKRYWRIGTKDDNTSYWETMKTNNKICIGWSEIGDLNETEVKSKKDIIKLLKNKGFYQHDNRTISRKAGEIFNFYDINVGDVILAQDGAQVLGIGIVSDEYVYEGVDNFSHQKQTDWKIINPDFTNDVGLMTTVYELSTIGLKKQIDDFLYSKQTSLNTKNNYMELPLNQILFGPPGTGKTYHTTNKAIEIVNPQFNLQQDRKEVKKEYDKLVKENRIVFTTFHQSMNYEDFIEGIKPQNPEEDVDFLKYDVESGIFKKACAHAAYACYKELINSNQASEHYTFDDLYEAFISHVTSLIDNNTPPIYKTLRGNEVEIKEINRNNSIIARAKDSIANRSAPLTKENIQKLYDTFKSINQINNLSQVKDAVQITTRITEFYAVFGGLKNFEEKVFNPDSQLIKESKEVDTLDENEIIKKFNSGVFREATNKLGDSAPPIVIIIDEINRGNVSQIFGELITLIERDKRLGHKEALQVTLPYSKDSFGVPPNLYIIGTMNTADRSVEALDTALRRRFSFEEMPPNYALNELDYSVFNYKVSGILKTINNRIEKLLDKDHAIGHSFFIIEKEKNREKEIIKAFYKNIIPLLQEYFFGDYGKIGLVLGKGFIKLINWDKNTDGFADFDHDSTSDFEEREVYEIIDYRNENHNYLVRVKNNEIEMTFDKAIKLLMKDTIV
ncbi:AAA family ATPase [Zobellia alginiliquefaciens]|uniref:AAA family ATPase n=1 Tax=Zobellia alginiliquefaciens TaxID=3032586 RepID=UPI0023E406A1|nr:AAA family ATPase [Zobellia alginiliquefaciens]